MTHQNLLIELFVEELPPKALRKLGDAFAEVLFAQLKAQGLTSADSKLTAYASPRRLAVHVSAVAAQAADRAVSQKLMPVGVGLDAAGQATPALLKKLQALGADGSAVAGLKRAPDGKAEVLFYESTVTGVRVADGVQKALDEAIAKLPIPKVMSYPLADGWSVVNFVRPVHRLIALHGASVLAVKALGLQAGNLTEGHRFESSGQAFAIRDADSYEAQMRHEGAVIAGFADRKAEIARQLAAAAQKVGGGVHPVEDDALLDEVTALVERPNVLICEFEQEFLTVPQECLILTMKANQKYFPMLDEHGKLTNRFLVVSNICPDDASLIIGGNERVVRPRLADAKFFFDQDRRKSLESRVAGLSKVVYHNKLGTQGERMERVRAIAHAIVQLLRENTVPYTVQAHDELEMLAHKAEQAARLAKTDLLTDMVGEFPELQGIMGGYYARHDGLRDGVAIAIEDHYKPRFAGDALPRNHTGLVVALADKLETLVGMFGIGNLPTGDKDPFALRRHALGVVRILVERHLPLHFYQLTRAAFAAFAPGLLEDRMTELDEFLVERLKGCLRDGGYASAEVDAAIYARRLTEWGSLPKRLAAVRAFAALPEAAALAAANKRIANILKKAPPVDAHVSEVLLREPAEQALYAAMQSIAPRADALFEAGDYAASLQSLSALRDPVDAFFEGVMVNAEELDVRLNRQGLLQMLHEAMNRVADLSRLAA